MFKCPTEKLYQGTNREVVCQTPLSRASESAKSIGRRVKGKRCARRLHTHNASIFFRLIPGGGLVSVFLSWRRLKLRNLRRSDRL